MSVVEFKGTSLSVITMILKTSDVGQLRQALHDKLSRTPDFFVHEPIILDLRDLSYALPVPWLEIIALLKSYHLIPIACQHVSPALQDTLVPYLPVLQKEDVLDLSVWAERQKEAGAVEVRPAVVIDRPLRSGQKIYAEKADLIVMAMVSHGAEIISDYNIHVYAPLRGRALAGASGDTQSRIFTTSFNAELIAIAGIYSTFEKGLPKQFCHKPVKISLKRVDGERDTLLLEDLQSS